MSDDQTSAIDQEVETEETTDDASTLQQRALQAAGEDTETAESQRTETTEDDGPVDWEKRYKDLQSQYTPTTQELKALKEQQEKLGPWAQVLADLQNPETHQQALNWILENNGYEIADDDENTQEGEDDGLDELFHDPRVDELLTREQQREQQQAMSAFSSHLDQLIGEHELDLTDRQKQRLANECLQAGFNEQATEKVVKEWADEVQAERDRYVKDYLEKKRGQPAPAVKKGASGTEHVPLDTERKRREAALQIANEAFAD